MTFRNIWAVYWSGTGTTEKVVNAIADILASGLHAQRKTFDYTLPSARRQKLSFSKDDLVVVGTPVYAGRVPNLMLPFLKENLVGGGAAAIAVVLYGNRDFDDALIELRNVLEDGKFRTIAAAGFIGEHSFSRVLGAGRPDEKDMVIVAEFAHKTTDKAADLQEIPTAPVSVRGEHPVRPYYTPRDRAGNSINILKVKPKTDMRKCNHCGICAAVCPMGSINKDNLGEVTGICIKCCACVKKCPNNAKYYDDEGYLYHQHELEEAYMRRAEPELFY